MIDRIKAAFPLGKVIRFCIVGGIGAVIGLGLLYALTEWAGLFYLASLGIGWLIVSLIVYLGNCRWTFQSFKGIRGFGKFLVSRAGTTLAGFGLVALLTSGLGVWYMASPVIGAGIMAIANFLISRRWVWGEKIQKRSEKA